MTNNPTPEALVAKWRAMADEHPVPHAAVLHATANELEAALAAGREDGDLTVAYMAGRYDGRKKAEAAGGEAGPEGARQVRAMSEHSRVPDDYRNSALGYRAGWNDRHDIAIQNASGAVPEGFLAHVASVCRGVVDLCEPKPQRTPEDDREHNGGVCLVELGNIAGQIDGMLAAAQQEETNG